MKAIAASVYHGILVGFILDPSRKTILIKMRDGKDHFNCPLQGQQLYDNFIKKVIPVLQEGDDLHITKWTDKAGEPRALFAVPTIEDSYQEPVVVPIHLDATIDLRMQQEQNDPAKIPSDPKGD